MQLRTVKITYTDGQTNTSMIAYDGTEEGWEICLTSLHNADKNIVKVEEV